MQWTETVENTSSISVNNSFITGRIETLPWMDMRSGSRGMVRLIHGPPRRTAPYASRYSRSVPESAARALKSEEGVSGVGGGSHTSISM